MESMDYSIPFHMESMDYSIPFHMESMGYSMDSIVIVLILVILVEFEI